MIVWGINATGCKCERWAMSDSDQEHWTIAAVDSRDKPLVRYRIDEKREILFIQFFGVLTRESITAYAQAAFIDAKVEPSIDSLADLTSVEEYDISASDTAEALATFSKIIEKRTGKLAIVSGPDIGRRSFMRMYLAQYQHLKNRRAAAFETVEEAMTWLQE